MLKHASSRIMEGPASSADLADEGHERRRMSKRVRAFQQAIQNSKHHRHALELLSPTHQLKRQFRRLRKYYNRHSHELNAPKFFVLWLAWLFVGTLFYSYAPKSNLGIAKGFYMALNIGYSIGFGYPSEEPNNYLYFSSFYVLIGASFVGAALGFFADKIAKDNETWFTRMEQQQNIQQALKEQKSKIRAKIQAFVHYGSSALRALGYWMVFLVSMIAYSMVLVGWSFTEAQYFAVSTLSTGGHWSIPNDSPDWLFGMTGLFIMIGVPVTAMAMAQAAFGFMNSGDIDEAKATIDAVVTKEELVFLQELGLEIDGKVDKAEFIILCMVRTGTDPGLIQYITQRFAELNFYTGEALSVPEITQGSCKFVDGKVRRSQSVNVFTLETVSELQAAIVTDDEADDESCDSYSADDADYFSFRSSSRNQVPKCLRCSQNCTPNISLSDGNPERISSVGDQGPNGAEPMPGAGSNLELETPDTQPQGTESTFLRQLIQKLRLPKEATEYLSDTTGADSNSHALNEACLNELERAEVRTSLDALEETLQDEIESKGASSVVRLKRFLDDLKQECASLTSHNGSVSGDVQQESGLSFQGTYPSSNGSCGNQQSTAEPRTPNDNSQTSTSFLR